MTHSPRLKRSLELLLIGSAAGVAVACGSQASELAGDLADEVGDMLSDAGSQLIDAGNDMLAATQDAEVMVVPGEGSSDAAEHNSSDATATPSDSAAPIGELLSEAGAALMTDAGELLRDAGALLHEAGVDAHESGSQMASDASAQACATCSSGALRALPASENPEQQLGGSYAKGSWTVEEHIYSGTSSVYALYAVLGEGPMVITDLERAHSGTAVMNVYAVPRGIACVALHNQASYIIPATARTLLLPATNASVHGAHINVRASERACALAATAINAFQTSEQANQGTNAAIAWSGYRLYE